jgi:predicted SnoaL-like aldol condensation-catalyzing enzyme
VSFPRRHDLVEPSCPRRGSQDSHKPWINRSGSGHQHSAHVEPGRDGLFNLIKAARPDLRYENALAVAEANYVLLHGRFSNNGQPRPWIVVDIVRLENGLLAEHWDVIQNEAGQKFSKTGLPMFGDHFPD